MSNDKDNLSSDGSSEEEGEVVRRSSKALGGQRHKKQKRLSLREQAERALAHGAVGQSSRGLAKPQGSRLSRGLPSAGGVALEAVQQRGRTLAGHAAYRKTSSVAAEMPSVTYRATAEMASMQHTLHGAYGGAVLGGFMFHGGKPPWHAR